MPKHTNRLAKETSPYLLQHAHNPVDWYPWGEEAFAKAKAENKPILLSIGYSTCHWCHVMERESFEDERIAAYMNRHFVNIKLDREERPDIDQIYMEAAQALTGSGGWPLNCFLTPDLRPFYAGTYFPPEPRHRRPSWAQVLQGLLHSYHNKRDDVDKQAERLTGFIRTAGDHFTNELRVAASSETVFTPVMADNMFHALKESFDTEHGGFGGAPKFPGTMPLQYLLHYHYFSKNKEALAHVELSLRKMRDGGIYDQLGGGIARYSTDAEWLAPHFEKMLYDNALYVTLLSEVYSLTGKKEYADTIHHSLEWVAREMTSPEGGFYSALDADSEGEEGKFYVWDKAEVVALLSDDSPFFCRYYDVTAQGNWEGKNILRRISPLSELADKAGMEEIVLQKLMSKWEKHLLLEREKRIRPGLDDKILLDWNALMCSAYCQAFRATGKAEYRDIAVKNMSFIYHSMQRDDGFYHSYKEGQGKHPAFLADYAYLIEALLELYAATFEVCYLHEAKRLADYTITHFHDGESKLFHFTRAGQSDVIARQKEVYDNALPSGNSTMVRNLRRLSVLFGEEAYRQMARGALLAMSESVERYPRSFARWAAAALGEVFPLREIAVLGDDAHLLAEGINKMYLPNKILMAALGDKGGFPLLEQRYEEGRTLIYLCSDYQCQRPVDNIGDLLLLMDE